MRDLDAVAVVVALRFRWDAINSGGRVEGTEFKHFFVLGFYEMNGVCLTFNGRYLGSDRLGKYDLNTTLEHRNSASYLPRKMVITHIYFNVQFKSILT